MATIVQKMRRSVHNIVVFISNLSMSNECDKRHGNPLRVDGNKFKSFNQIIRHYLLVKLVGHMSIFGATDTPVSDFW